MQGGTELAAQNHVPTADQPLLKGSHPNTISNGHWPFIWPKNQDICLVAIKSEIHAEMLLDVLWQLYRFPCDWLTSWLLAGQIRGQVSVCRAWNKLPNNVEHKVEAIMEPFRSPPGMAASLRDPGSVHFMCGRHSLGHGFDLQVLFFPHEDCPRFARHRWC